MIPKANGYFTCQPAALFTELTAPFSPIDLAQFWAKTDTQAAAECPMHPVVAHSLDVAAVAMSLPETMLPQIDNHPIDRRLLGFLASLHDIGKLGATFQFLRPDRSRVRGVLPVPPTVMLPQHSTGTGA